MKSSASGADGCVQVALDGPNTILVRDSKDPDGTILTFTGREWDVFVDGIKRGEFDREHGLERGRPAS